VYDLEKNARELKSVDDLSEEEELIEADWKDNGLVGVSALEVKLDTETLTGDNDVFKLVK
jgi:hypothetical protein